MSDTTSTTNEVWARVSALLTLSTEHARILLEKRGIGQELAEKLQIRSSLAENRRILSTLTADFSEENLIESGIFRRFDFGLVPERKLCGYGMTGKKDENGNPIREEGVNPILIPYLNASGVPEIFRPHKDSLQKPRWAEDDDGFTSMQTYCEYLLRVVSTMPLYDVALSKFCVITEGEFKAMALVQCGIPAIAFPGIQSMRNMPFAKALLAMLDRMGIEDVVIAFDNETKDDPAFPDKYKADPYNRFDSIVYAKYTARVLRNEGIYKVRVGMLPDEWRENGKADWDGALANFIHNSNSFVQGVTLARKEFLKVLKSASEEAGVLELFPSEDQRIIENKISKLFLVHKCLFGNDKIRKIANRIRPVNPSLSKALLSCCGTYFERKPPKISNTVADAMRIQIEKARKEKDFAKATTIEQELLGWPKPISNFVSTCDYRLVRPDGRREYLVKFRTTNRDSTNGHIRVQADAASGLRDFRKLCQELFSGTWAGGEKDLQDLTSDWQAESAGRDIHEVEGYGLHGDSGLWKFGDRAFTKQDKMILPDENMVFWHDGIGYQTDFRKAALGDGFQQGAPILGDLDESKAALCFYLMSKHIFDAVGDFSGFLLVGSAMSYILHPEILKAYNGAPGIWITGRKGGGKTTIAEWLTMIFGFTGLKATLTAETTGTFVSRELAKYHFIPAWFDEYRDHETRPEVKALLRNAFDRSAGGKGTFDGSLRTRAVRPGTTPIVTGETSCSDAATRSRYLNVTLISEKAIGNAAERLRIMKANAPDFRNIGHFLLKHRQEFKERTMAHLNAWVNHPSLSEYSKDVRLRFVSGTPFAAWMAAAEMLQKVAAEPENISSLLAKENQLFEFTREMTNETQKDTIEVSFIMRFWHDILSLCCLSPSPILKFIRLRWVRNAQGRVQDSSKDNVAGSTPALYIDFKMVYFIYEQEVQKHGRSASMSLSDLRRELQREKYWLLPKESGESHRVRFHETNDGKTTCWAFDILDHPLGEEFLDAIHPDKAAANQQWFKQN